MAVDNQACFPQLKNRFTARIFRKAGVIHSFHSAYYDDELSDIYDYFIF